MEYIYINRPEFVEPIRVLFLCGATFRDNNKDKRIVLKEHLEKDPQNKVIILEKYFEFGGRRRKDGFLSYYQANLFNLFNIEQLAALTATKVIIIHESLSTAGELGVFGSNPSLRNRILALVPEKYTIEEEKISSFLLLAFWHKKAPLIPEEVLRYYPETKKVIISDHITKYYTYFSNDTLPPYIGDKIDEAVGVRTTVNVCLSHAGENGYLKYKSNIKHIQDCTYVNLEYDVFKNYMIALLSIPDVRRKLSDCDKVYKIISLFKEAFISVLNNTIKDLTKTPASSKLIISINGQPELELDNAVSFMVYIMHSCGLINIKNEDGNLISVHHCKGTSDLFHKYSCLVQKIEAMDWGK